MHAADRLLQAAVSDHVFQAGCLLVALEGQPVHWRSYGAARLDSVFDLASLTKPLVTTALSMRLVVAGKLSPRTCLSELLPELEGVPLGAARVEHLLSHSSGLPAWRPFYESVAHLPPARARQRIRRLILREGLEVRPGTRAIYSDLGFMLLQWIIERVGGQRIDRLARQQLAAPLGLTRTGYVDLGAAAASRRPGWQFVPTERCPRRGRMRGEVHDDNCHAMGGVGGHAGLFASAHDVHLLVRELVAAYQGGRSIFDPPVLRHFFRRRPVAGSSWVLGWDTPSGPGSSAGSGFGPHSVGHLGFTGTSLWIDLDRPLWVILLTNRVYYGREPNRLKPLRPRLHDAIVRELGRRA